MSVFCFFCTPGALKARSISYLSLFSEVIATLGVIGVNEVIDDTTMRDVNDHLSYKTNVFNFFNFANFVNFKQVEFAKFELTLRTPIKNIYDLLLGLFCLTLRRRREKSATKEAFLIYPGNRNRQFHNRRMKINNAHLWYIHLKCGSRALKFYILHSVRKL